jgi:hypothetical protein
MVGTLVFLAALPPQREGAPKATAASIVPYNAILADVAAEEAAQPAATPRPRAGGRNTR